MSDTKKMIWTGVVCTLFILANIISSKIVMVLKLPISCSIFIYPFTFLGITMLCHKNDYKTGLKGIFIAISCLILACIMITIVCNLPNQSGTIESARAMQTLLTPEVTNGIYHPSIRLILSSILAFLVSQMINVGMYSFASKYTFKIAATFLAFFLSLMIDATLFLLINNYGLVSMESLGNMFLSQFIFRVIFTILLTIIFAILSFKKD